MTNFPLWEQLDKQDCRKSTGRIAVRYPPMSVDANGKDFGQRGIRVAKGYTIIPWNTTANPYPNRICDPLIGLGKFIQK